tara:strand:+ start:289 stop:705 length:417 start_codon:yes stop_codon:yes gene_type:complete
MKKKFITLIAVFMMIWNNGSKANEHDWQLYDEQDNGIKYYIDLNSYIEKGKMSYITTMQDFSKLAFIFKSMRMDFEVDCKKERSRPVRAIVYKGLMGNGEEMDITKGVNREWGYATGFLLSPNDLLLGYMCNPFVKKD